MDKDEYKKRLEALMESMQKTNEGNRKVSLNKSLVEAGLNILKSTPKKRPESNPDPGYSTGMKKGGKVSSASKRADGCAQRGKTRGKFV